MAPMEITNQNVVTRMVSLPLVSSTYDMVSSVYCNTKDNHPFIKSVCEAAEMGVKTITSAAFTSALPIISKLEPQISLANDLACKGLDKVEKTLPILHQPSGQLIANAKEAVSGAKDTVTGAKETVSHALNGVVGKTRGVVQEGVDKTKMVVSGGVHTVMDSKVARLVNSGMDNALSTSESLVENYLPGAEEGQETGENVEEPSYYVRLGSLSTKLRRRAYQTAIAKVYDAKKQSQEVISQLNHTVDLIERTRKNIDGANQKMYEKLNTLMDWRSRSPSDMESNINNDHEIELIESRTLTIAHNLTQQLQTTCLALVSSLQGLPHNVHNRVLSVGHLASEVYAGFSKAASLSDLSDKALSNTRGQLNQMRDSIDGVMDYLVNNTPLNWLVGPFFPRPEPSASSSRSQSSDMRSGQPELEMQLLDEGH
ncbi:perilipin-2 [Brachyhypopomus gauderio]|uniref:perilipin-2 n=1 Tax=Brachyhypopomus gauderio TaxID=698409 RepID=UPI00404224C7